jgi:hypothetical protein
MPIGMLAAACVLAGAACDSTHHTASPSGPAQKQPKKDPVTYDMAVASRDGKRIAVVKHVGSSSYLEIGPAGGGPRRTIYRSSYWISSDLYWASRNLIAFGDSNIEANTINVRTRRVHLRIATATSFNISSNGRWIAWSQLGAEEAPDTVGVVSITGRECLPMPRPKNRSYTLAFFKPGVARLFFLRTPYDPSRGVVGSGQLISVPMASLRRQPSSACQR